MMMPCLVRFVLRSLKCPTSSAKRRLLYSSGGPEGLFRYDTALLVKHIGEGSTHCCTRTDEDDLATKKRLLYTCRVYDDAVGLLTTPNMIFTRTELRAW